MSCNIRPPGNDVNASDYALSGASPESQSSSSRTPNPVAPGGGVTVLLFVEGRPGDVDMSPAGRPDELREEERSRDGAPPSAMAARC